MDLPTFVSTNKGEVLDNGLGGYPGECVSLVWQYANEVQHVPLGVLYCSTTGGARDLYEQFDGKIPQYYDRVPKEQLQPGDIVVWGGSMGPLGHTAPKIDGPALTVFEQMVGVPARIRTYTNTNGVLGGLRLKGEEMLDASHQSALFAAFLGRLPLAEEVSRDVGKKTIETMVNELDQSSEYADKKQRDNQAYSALNGQVNVIVNGTTYVPKEG